MDKCSDAAKKYVKDSIKAGQSTDKMVEGFKNTSRFANFASISLKALSIACNVLLNMAISLAISMIAKGFQNLANAQENAVKKADEVVDKFNEQQRALTENKKNIESVWTDYEKLANGVDSLGRNISLNTEEYSRYNEIVNQIAKMFPQMVQGYTDEGNAIIRHKGSVEELTRAYQEQKKAAQDAIIVGGADVYEGFKAKVDYEKHAPWEESGILQMKEYVEKVIATSMDEQQLSMVLLEGHESGVVKDVFDKLGLDTSKWSSSDYIREHLSQFQSLINTFNAELNAEAAKVKPVMQAYLDKSFELQKVDDDVQDVVRQIVGQVDAEFFRQFDDETKMAAWIDKNIVQKFKNDEEMTSEFKMMFDIQTQFNNDAVTVGEYQEKLTNFLAVIEDLPENIKKYINLLFGISVDDEGNSNSEVDILINNINDKLQGHFQEEIKDLSLSELEVLSGLDISWNDELDWDTIKKMIAEASVSTEKITDIVKTFNKEMDDLQERFNTVQSAIEDYNKNGHLSIDTAQKLLELDDKYLASMVDENGQVTLNTKAFEELTRAKLEDLKASAVASLNSWIDSLEKEGVTARGLAEKYIELGAAKEFAMGEVKTGYQVGNEWVDVTNTPEFKAFLVRIAAINDAINGIGKNGLTGDAEKKKKKQLADAWKKEHLETLKDGIKEQEEILKEYKQKLEVFDFGLSTTETDDFASRADLLMSKIEGITDYGVAMRKEFDRLAETVPETAEEAQELASRLQSLGSDMRSNVTELRKAQTELQKLQVEMTSTLIKDRTKELDSILDNINKRIEILSSDYKSEYRYVNEMLSLDLLLPTYSDADKKRREKRRTDQALIDTEQETQDKINEIVQKSLQMQFEKNKKERERERQELIKDFAKTATIVSDGMSNISDIVKQNPIKPEVDLSNVYTALDEIRARIGSSSMWGVFSPPSNPNGGDIVNTAAEYEGTPYVYSSGHGKMGNYKYLDCSGYVSQVLMKLGYIDTSYTADGFKKVGVKIPPSDMQPGDLLIFDYGKDGHADHVAFYAGDGKIWHSKGGINNTILNPGKGVTLTDYSDYFKNALVQVNRVYASGTPSGNAQASRFGIAGENYKPEILIDKASGKATYIDSPTVIDTSVTDVVGEKQTARLPKFADGTSESGIQDFYDRVVNEIGKLLSKSIVNMQSIENDSGIDDFTRSKQLYAIKHGLGEEASRIGTEVYKELFDIFNNWLNDVENGTAEWSLDLYNEYVDTLRDIRDYSIKMAEDAVKTIQDSAEARWKLSEKYINERNKYNDWTFLYDDSEVKAWERVVKWLKDEYPNDLEKIRDAELSLFEARKNEFNKAISLTTTYINSQKTLLQEHYDITNAIEEAHHNINKELETSKTMYEWLDEETRQLLFNQEDYNKLNSELNAIQRRANKLQSEYEYHLKNATAETIESITSEYEMQYKTLMKSYEIAKADLEIAKKKQKLNNVLNERNVRMFINGRWQWVANTQDVIDAKSELADAEYARRVEASGLEQQKSIDNLTRQQNSLNIVVKSFENGVISLKEAVETASRSVGSLPYAVAQMLQNARVDTTAITSGSTSRSYAGVGYDSTKDYAEAINNAATVEEALRLNRERNAKISGEGRSEAKISDSTIREAFNILKKNKGYASGTSYTRGGLTALGENGFEAYIGSSGRLIPIDKPTIGNIPSGGIVFNSEQMRNLKALWDMSNLGLDKYKDFFNGGKLQTVDQSQDNRIIINGMTVDSSSANGQALIDALRRYVGNH